VSVGLPLRLKPLEPSHAHLFFAVRFCLHRTPIADYGHKPTYTQKSKKRKNANKQKKMNAFPRNPSSSSPTTVHVEVKGSLDIVLNLDLLSDLNDPLMEQSIVKEAVRIAVSEKLGYFDGLDVRLSSSGGREGTPSKPGGQHHLQQLTESPTAAAAAAATTRSKATRCCEVEIDLQRLGGCVEAIQTAYDNVLAQMHLIHEVLCSAGPFPSPLCHPSRSDATSQQQEQQQRNPALGSSSSPDFIFSDVPSGPCRTSQDGAAPDPSSNSPLVEPASVRYADAVNRLAAARHVVEGALQRQRANIVSEAAALREANQLQCEADMLAQEHRTRGEAGIINTSSISNRQLQAYVNNSTAAHAHLDHEDGVDAELRRGLLADDEEEEEEMMGHRHTQDNTNDDDQDEGDQLDEEALHARYRKAGYCAL
jgi:hypothetical protein